MDIIEEARSRITHKETGVLNACASDYPGTCGIDDTWKLSKFKKNFRIVIIRHNNLEMEFDMIDIHAGIANALRRILLSEVPSMAIEKVFVYNNTSIIQDEVLAHRLGLIPLKADPRLFEYRQKDDEDGTEQDTLEFELKVKCTLDPSVDASAPVRDKKINGSVYTKHIKWLPIGAQGNMYTAQDVGPIHDDILISKMMPGHELDLKLHAVKGIGKDHAKFSPVATAFYRLHPEVTLLKDIEGEAAERLQKCFSPGVIGLEDGKNGKKKAKVLSARYDTCSRNVFRYDDLKNAVKMERIRDHYIFTIESVGALPPDVLFTEAVKVLKQKCRTFLEELNR
ncbi:DNA-directed RNA polymerases I and III subunit RPAC1 [Schistocerca nitens]|uniref:DNA-directed RNA polymerases I and III subunit RPAC1 n=1 Tax=Schistocerca nitens TaxID=7011 RepID=UPI00211790E0|nr:DNA-directed RNA polymerases I and III subunit RPAC1 [Schistocerca nitens]